MPSPLSFGNTLRAAALLALALSFVVASAAAAPIGYVVPRRAGEIANSMWGVQSGDNERVKLFERAGELGVKWTRFLAVWPTIEREKGRYDFASLDAPVNAARANGITPFVCLSNGNRLYSEPIPHPDPNWRLIYGVKPAPPILDAAATAAWLRYVDAVVAHAKDRVTHWEIWNVDTWHMRAQLSVYFKLFDGGNRADRQERPELKPVDHILGFPAEATGKRVRGKGVNEKCLLSNPDLAPKPAFYAYRNLTALMDGRYRPAELNNRAAIRVTAQGQFAGVGEHDDAYPSIPLTAAYRTEAGVSLVAYWLPWQPQEYTPRPARITLRLPASLAFREPVLVNLLDGAVHGLPAPRREGGDTVFENLPMFDFPLVVAERAEVRFGAERHAPVLETTPVF